MSYRVVVRPPVLRLIGGWGLSTELFVEVHLRLRETLAARPSHLLVPSRDVSGGMIYPFSLVDPHNRFAEHTFEFGVLYGMDEQTLYVVSGSHHRQSGFL